MIRLGLDMHGVINAAPKLFSNIACAMLERDNEVYIVTGREVTDELLDELRACNMINDGGSLYTDILSITSYQKQLGTPVCYLNDDPTQPMMDPRVWNQSKAVLCATANIDIMIDDSSLYEPFFRDIKTQYIIFTSAMQEMLSLMCYGGI
jgi:hypothetical protein